MNPDSDATAIWLERKFDVPASGSWASESVFSIPISSVDGPPTSGYPGLIVFECSPLGDITDDLEKYVLLGKFRNVILMIIFFPAGSIEFWMIVLDFAKLLEHCHPSAISYHPF